MPIFEFICKQCGHQFEWFIASGDGDDPWCSECRSYEVLKRPSIPAIHFKGEGWTTPAVKEESK